MAKWISYTDEDGVTYFNTEKINTVGTYVTDSPNPNNGTVICLNNGNSYLFKNVTPEQVYSAIRSSKVLFEL